MEKEVFERVGLLRQFRTTGETKWRAQISAKDYSNDTLRLTSQLLHQNPEYYTIWNHRRVILESKFATELASGEDASDVEEGDTAAAEKANLTVPQREILLVIKEDLEFQIPLLKQWPKCYWIWNHRQWLLMTATQHLPSHATIGLWKAELGLVGKMLSMDSRNFHGWNYRRVVVENIERLSGSSMCEAEFQYTTKMIESNLSNFSAWHNRGQLLPRLLDERGSDEVEREKTFNEEFELITNALYTDPYDQSLWFYHQYLMAALEERNPKAPVLLNNVDEEVRIEYLKREIKNVREMLDGAEDCKYIYQALLEYSRRYLTLDAGASFVGRDELTSWLSELNKIDPLRRGRWDDLEKKLGSTP